MLPVTLNSRLALIVSCLGVAVTFAAKPVIRLQAVGGEFTSDTLRPAGEYFDHSGEPFTYYVDPVHGNDTNDGVTARSAWKTLARVNSLSLGPGSTVVIAPGILDMTLMPNAAGTESRPAKIAFTSGVHLVKAARATKVSYFVSNSADDPSTPRPVGILVKHCRHLRIVGDPGSELVYGDRMTEFINDQSEDITYSGLTFDMSRPTVSEFRVLSAGASQAVIRPAEGSTYSIADGHFSWTGDLGTGWTMVQEAVPETGTCVRLGKWDPFAAASATQLTDGSVRLTYKSDNMGMRPGHQYQFRNVKRDTTSAVNTRCKNLQFSNCRFYALPGMAIVSQFTENLTFRKDAVEPKPGTLRTCPAWADCFHFSGCRGQILVDGCRFSGTQDDPINVHGTFLRVVEKTATNQVLVRFMHPQTYGFAAFQPGDDIDFVSHASLLAYFRSKVISVDRRTDTDWLLTFESSVPGFSVGDVVDNVSWYPDLTIRNCSVTMDSCRGFLITTRGKVLVENNTFARTAMSAIDIADDANSWYESGSVRDVTIRNNRFIECGEPAISIHPENLTNDPNQPVHENITISANQFLLAGKLAISAKSVRNLRIFGNLFSPKAMPIKTSACTAVRIEGNH